MDPTSTYRADTAGDLSGQPLDEETLDGIDSILKVLDRERGLDFRLYRLSTISRRLSQRMSAVRTPSYAAYRQLLEREPSELDRLIHHLTLKVTSFFRNPAVFALLRNVLADLLEQGQVDVWSAGCATGEEPYSIAIALAELIGLDALRTRAFIIATDIDERALETAEQGEYLSSSLDELPVDTLERWFRPLEACNRLQVHDQLRAAVKFVRHSLIDADGPPPESGRATFHLVLCRNVLIYFQRPLQNRVVDLLHRSVQPGGYLVLGEAETLPQAIESHYHCVDRRSRIYQKKVPS